MPPSRSGIADYSAELFQALRTMCDLEVFTDPASTVYGGNGDDAVFPYSAFLTRSERVPFDLNVYHMGNSGEHHGIIYQRLLQQPGIVVLHDATMFDFYWDILVTMARGEDFLDEVEHNFGSETRALMPLFFQDKLSLDRLAFHLARRTVEASLAVIVHSEWARVRFDTLYAQSNVIHIPHGTPLLESTTGSAVRELHGWGPDMMVIGVFGRIGRAKRLETVVDAFRRVYRDHPNTRLLVAGRVDDGFYAREIRETIRNAGLEDIVSIEYELPFDQFEQHLAAVDLVVNLRRPSAGETSGALIRALGAGKVVIASDLPQVREWDRRFCWLVAGNEEQEAGQLAQHLAYAATHLDEIRRTGEYAQSVMHQTSTWETVAHQYVSLFDQVLAWYVPAPATPAAVEHPPAPGLNVIGDFAVANGLSEAASSTVSAIIGQGIPTSYIEPVVASDRKLFAAKPHAFRSLPRGSLFPVNLSFHNIDEMHTIDRREWEAAAAGKYTIASWFYELPRIPDLWLDAFDRVDEIWVPSRYTQTSMLTVAQVPVTVIPVPVEVKTSPAPHRGSFSIPSHRYVFYCSFSAASCSGRKNPWGVIDAFRRAFGSPGDDGPLLVMKVHYLSRYPVLQEALQAAVKSVGGTLIEHSFSRQQTNDLLFCADAYISLHRSEGFGLGMAESMYLGKPVIGTYHSGNVDFMTEENSFPIRCTLRPVTLDDHRYQPECSKIYEPGQLWAEPDLDQAASRMEYVYTNRAEARQVARRGARDIRLYCSPQAVGRAIDARLLELGVPGPTASHRQEVGAYVDRS